MSDPNSILKDTGSVEQTNRLVCMYAKTIFHHELTLRHSGFLLFRNKICPEVFKISKSVLQSKISFIWQWAECWWKKDMWYFNSLSLRGLNHPLLFYHIIFLKHVSFCLAVHSFFTNLLVQFPDYLAYLIINDSVFSVSLTQISGWPNS